MKILFGIIFSFAIMSLSSITYAESINVSLLSLEPVSPSYGKQESWCNIRFRIENDTDWLGRQIAISVSSSDSSSEGRNHAFLDLRNIPSKGGGIYVSETTKPCSSYIGAFQLGLRRSHLGYICNLVNHTDEQCYQMIAFNDTRSEMNDDLSTEENFGAIRFGMTQQEAMRIFPGFEVRSTVMDHVPGNLRGALLTNRFQHRGFNATKTFLVEQENATIVAEQIQIPQGTRYSPQDARRACDEAIEELTDIFGEPSIKRHEYSSTWFWRTADGARLVEVSEASNTGTVARCSEYQFASSIVTEFDSYFDNYFGVERLEVLAIDSFSSLEGIYTRPNASVSCNRQSYDPSAGYVGIYRNNLEVAEWACPLEDAQIGADGLSLRTRSECFTFGGGATEVEIDIRVMDGQLELWMNGSNLGRLERCGRF